MNRYKELVATLLMVVFAMSMLTGCNTENKDDTNFLYSSETQESSSETQESSSETQESSKPQESTISREAKPGSTVFFGKYEQDNNTSNGKEDIEWIVLAREGDRILVISRYALDNQPYNSSYTKVTWETCSLRKWLNGTFLNEAFSENERAIIPSVTVSADKNPLYDTSPGNSTKDQVFLLSITEANKYFSSDSARRCQGTAYYYAQGGIELANKTWWWLRSPGSYLEFAASVQLDGRVIDDGTNVYEDLGIRPALWIELE